MRTFHSQEEKWIDQVQLSVKLSTCPIHVNGQENLVVLARVLKLLASTGSSCKNTIHQTGREKSFCINIWLFCIDNG